MILIPIDPKGPFSACVRPWLAAACARPGCDLTVEDLIEACARREAQLIGIFEHDRFVAAGVVQDRVDPSGARSCWVLAVGGSGARAWRHTLREIEDGAAFVGCASVEFVGRPGWARLLPDYAAAPCETGTHYAKRLG